METINIISITTIAFLGSFGHCIGMCGGIVVAYSSAKIDSGFNKKKKIISHLLYSFGRVVTYMIIGILFGYFGSLFSFDGQANTVFRMITSIIMILAGLSLIGKIKFLTLIEYNFLNTFWYKNKMQNLIKSTSYKSFFLLGLLNGLLPCGFVYFFAITAASTASPIYGALVMLIFGLSTIPALFFLGFFVSLFNKTSIRDILIKLAALFVIIYGVIELYRGYMFYIKTMNIV
ncbi:MAG: sulfite exporter TauE/SafE family protein [Sulfurospirillum sp.]|nr:sulfite exporter TauE/SafE family protein [Sulfurospirillum sp.]MBL0703518.1 sulfite exporter TauE/SafE family protein [Sulfurospirillum sp.]